MKLKRRRSWGISPWPLNLKVWQYGRQFLKLLVELLVQTGQRSACPTCTKHSKSTELRKLTKLLADLRTAMLLLYQGLKPQAAQVSVFELEELSFTCFASLAPCTHCTLLASWKYASVVASASQPTGLLQITDQLLLLCKLHNLRMLEERFPVTLHYQQMQTSATHLTMRTSFSKRQKRSFQQFLHLS